MSESTLLIHAIWSTLNQKPQLNKKIQTEVIEHVIQNAKKRSIEIYAVCGGIDHLHVIIRLHSSQSLSQVIHNIKGEVSFWINTQNFTKEPFQWQEGFNAASLSPSNKRKMKKYLYNHKLIHENMTYLQEVRMLKMDKLLEVLA